MARATIGRRTKIGGGSVRQHACDVAFDVQDKMDEIEARTDREVTDG